VPFPCLPYIIVGVNSWGEFISTQFVMGLKEGIEQHKHQRICGKPAQEKNHGAKREIPLNQRNYKEFSALCSDSIL